MVKENEICELAYTIWEQEGCPDGKHLEHYYRAEQILIQREALTIRTIEIREMPVAVKPKSSKPKTAAPRKKSR